MWYLCSSSMSLYDILVFRYNSGPTFNPSLPDFFACFIAARQTRQICWKVMACLTSTSCMIRGIIYVCQFMCRLKVHYTWQYLIMYSLSCRLRCIWFSFFCWTETAFLLLLLFLNNPYLWVNIMQVNGTIKANSTQHDPRNKIVGVCEKNRIKCRTFKTLNHCFWPGVISSHLT